MHDSWRDDQAAESYNPDRPLTVEQAEAVLGLSHDDAVTAVERARENRPLTVTEAEAMFEATDAAELARQERAEVRIRFVYLIDGEPKLGTVDDYAHDLDHGALAGVEVSRLVHVLTTDERGAMALREAQATVTMGDYDDDDYSTVTVRVADDVSSYRIDGRA